MSKELNQFDWKPCPEGQQLLDELIAGFLENNFRTQELEQRMQLETGTRFFDWIDSIQSPVDSELASSLASAGFVRREAVWEHPGAIFPRIRETEKGRRLNIKVESVSDFLCAWQMDSKIEGIPQGPLRIARAWEELWVVERHGYRGFEPPPAREEQVIQSLKHLERFRTRKRDFDGDDESAFEHTENLIDRAIAELGESWTCDLFFAAERDFWMRRNRAGRLQKARQDRLGLGWANHDHHTYRCRRKTFHRVIGLLEKMGFTCRERFYAGSEAGWGAQIVEHLETGITVFADVDMTPEEVGGDFAHEGLSDQDELGTVGLWCELHGESMLEAGMHHLEAQFDFKHLGEQILEESGIQMMKPFSDFEFLKQQFTEGERWKVAPSRIQLLLDNGKITEVEAEEFRNNGAIGSHLENLERNDGFKGFNQKGISDIIARTDARKQTE